MNQFFNNQSPAERAQKLMKKLIIGSSAFTIGFLMSGFYAVVLTHH